MVTRVGLAAAAAALLALGCSNAGEGRVLGIGGTATLRGTVYLDQNGNLVPEGGIDSALSGVLVRLLAQTSGDTVASATSDVAGIYDFASIPVGTYRIAVDTSTIGDSVEVAKIDSASVTLLPDDTSIVDIGVSFPRLSIAEARLLPPGRRVFVTGIALNNTPTFRDTTVHLQDATAAIRAARIRPSFIGAGDSVRLRGTTARRANLPTIEDVSVFSLGVSFLPTAIELTTLEAGGAAAGTRDAQQIVIRNATVSDTATAGADFRLTVDDGSGALEVLLDGVADPAFRPPLLPGQFIPGNRFDVVGVLVPSGTPGVWRLKPRSVQDLVLQ